MEKYRLFRFEKVSSVSGLIGQRCRGENVYDFNQFMIDHLTFIHTQVLNHIRQSSEVGLV